MTAIRCFTRFLILTSMVCASMAWADLHPNRDRGFTPGRVYDFGDIDNVNLFNGNVVVTIPVGPTYNVGGDLSYRLTLVNTGNPWSMYRKLRRSDMTDELPAEEQWPNPRSNAGLGWQVSLGQMIVPQDPFNSHFGPPDTGGWVYMSPDGHEQELGMLQAGGEFPDRGLRRTRQVSSLDGVIEQVLEKADGTIHRFNEITGQLRSIEDRFGYRIDVDTSTPGQWKITDGPAATPKSQRRYQLIVFKTDPADEGRTVIDYIELAAFGGRRAKYEFGYEAATILRGCVHDTRLGEPHQVNVALLKSVMLPDGNGVDSGTNSRYLFDYERGDITKNCGDIVRDASGLLRTLTLPTGGRYDWTRQMYQFPTLPQDMKTMRAAPGIQTRVLTDLDGTSRTWTYTTAISSDTETVFCDDPKDPADQRCHYTELVNTVHEPDGSRTRRYFSVYPGGAQGPGPILLADPDQYGLNFSRRSSVGPEAFPRFISSESFDAGNVMTRREYRLFEGGKEGRLKAMRTVYLDDCATPADCRFQDTFHDGYDGFGKYRQSSTIGNFLTGEKARTTFTNYQGKGPNGEWVLDTYGEQCSALEATQRTAPLAGCSALPDAHVTHFTFDRTTGFLQGKRVLGGTAEAGTDLITAFTRTVNASDPYVETIVESHTGGDACRNVPCGHYSLTNVYRGGELMTAGHTGAGFRTTDLDLDFWSGLPATARDVSGEGAIDYDYDTMGRLKSAVPRAGALPRSGKTVYEYSSATLPAKVTERRYGGSASALLKRSWTYDGFARITREVTPHPDGTSERLTLYDSSGRVRSVSELHAPGQPPRFTTTDYDMFGRALTVTPPDNKPVSNRYTGARLTERKVFRATTETGETETFRCEVSDSLGRLVEVHEGAGRTSDKRSCASGATSVTRYTYDVHDRLTGVEMTAGGVTQHRTFEYDRRGLLLSESHPEQQFPTRYRGYGARGQATRRIQGPENGPFDVTYAFDSAERLLEVLETSTQRVLKQFDYHTANTSSEWRKGKLAAAKRTNVLASGVSISVTDSFTYAGRDGHISKKRTVVMNDATNVSRAFEQGFQYDVLGNLNVHDYPQCDNCTEAGPARSISAEYVAGKGFLTAVSGFADAISYWPNGLMKQVLHSNGVTESQDIDESTGMARPKAFRFEGWTAAPVPCGAPSLSGPADHTIAYDGAANLTVGVTASGGTLSYQWFRGTAPDTSNPAGTSSVLSLTSVRETASYWVRVINACASGNASSDSRTATVTVSATACTAPTVHGPLNADVAYDGSGMLTVDASAPSGVTLSYQWYRGTAGDTSNPVGTNAPYYGLTAVRENAAYWVRVKSTCAAGTATTDSRTALVTVNTPACDPPAIVSGPPSFTVAFGDPAELKVSATAPSGATLSYQWYRGAAPDTTTPVGDGSATLALAAVTGNASYWVRVKSTCASGTVTVNSGTAVIIVELARPGRAVATQGAGGVIRVDWPPVTGATSYTVSRKDSSGVVTTFNVTTNSYTDQNTSIFVQDTDFYEAYVYWVVAHRGPGESSLPGGADVAVMTFRSLTFRVDVPVRAIDLAELRNAVDALRKVAGLPRAWTAGYEPVPGRPILAADWAELRQKLSDGRDLLYDVYGMPRVDLDVVPVVGMPIRHELATAILKGVR